MKTSTNLASVCALAALVFLIAAPISNALTPQFIIVGTGGVTGIYYPAGGAICRMLNKSRTESGVRCSVEVMQGSVDNLTAIGEGEIDLAVVQSDAQYHAYHGAKAFSDAGANKELRSVFSLHPESFTIVARVDAGISTFDELRGKRVNIGNPGSGQREIMEALMLAKGWSIADFQSTTELSSDKQSNALCENSIDAFVFSVGHPAGALKEAANNCDVIVLSVEGPEVDNLVANNSFYRKTVVPGGLYRGNSANIPTFGVSASLVASSNIDADIVYLMVKNVFENLDSIRKMHPAFDQLNSESMTTNNPDIPMHKGALRYYQEVGLK